MSAPTLHRVRAGWYETAGDGGLDLNSTGEYACTLAFCRVLIAGMLEQEHES
jgi:hypothetical protein